MIGRPVAAGLGAALLLGAIFSQRSADPTIADPGSAAAVQSAITRERDDASNALRRLQAALEAALVEGRQGAALTIQTADRPGPHLVIAGQRIRAAEPLIGTARSAMQLLGGNLAIDGRPAPEGLDVATGDLVATGEQLAASASAADAFWSMHRSTQAALTAIGAALAALDMRDATAALHDLDQADASLAEVRAWPGKLDTLPIWIDTTTKLARAVRSLAEAVRDDDLAAAEAADARYRAVAAEAHSADLGLAIAVAEGGGGVSATPLASAADALRAVGAALTAVNDVAVAASILA
ncbi:MAG: hypothetical protein M3P14_01865 [Chloroflexota bacterium]|nr:hypothetical protein [Chloroflexota bacterium]